MPPKNPHAVELGRLGGLARVPKGTATLPPDKLAAHMAMMQSKRDPKAPRKSSKPKCACGAMTLDRAAKRNHRCG